MNDKIAADGIPDELMRSLEPIPEHGPSLVLFLRSLKQFLSQQRQFIAEDESYQLRVLKCLHAIKLGPGNKRGKRGTKRPQDFDSAIEKSPEKALEDMEAELRNLFSQVVLEFLGAELTRRTYVKVLLHIHDRIIPSMGRPLLLADFLTASFRRGGLISVLALNGLFTLIQNHHLDFPQFYEKFYGLLTPDVLVAKYRARFFYLADLFMSSTYVPQYTVAAVAKRMSRLSLTAPADALTLVLTFTLNLLIRHPGLMGLINKVSEITNVVVDPYIESETDMQKTCASESSLWELATLSSHYNEDVAKYAAFLNDKLPSTEFDITDYLETDVKEVRRTALMIDAVLLKEDPVETTPATAKFALPSTLFPVKSQCFRDLWDLSMS